MHIGKGRVFLVMVQTDTTAASTLTNEFLVSMSSMAGPRLPFLPVNFEATVPPVGGKTVKKSEWYMRDKYTKRK